MDRERAKSATGAAAGPAGSRPAAPKNSRPNGCRENARGLLATHGRGPSNWPTAPAVRDTSSGRSRSTKTADKVIGAGRMGPLDKQRPRGRHFHVRSGDLTGPRSSASALGHGGNSPNGWCHGCSWRAGHRAVWRFAGGGWPNARCLRGVKARSWRTGPWRRAAGRLAAGWSKPSDGVEGQGARAMTVRRPRGETNSLCRERPWPVVY